jgi:hypothetical protein
MLESGLLYEIAPSSKRWLRDPDHAIPHRNAQGAALRTQARMAYLFDDTLRRPTDHPAKPEPVQLILLIAIVAVPWAATACLGWLLVRAF